MPPATAPSPEVRRGPISEKAFTTTNSSGAHARRTPNQNRLLSIESKLFLPDTELSLGDDSTRPDRDAWPSPRGYESGLLLGDPSSAFVTFVFALFTAEIAQGSSLSLTAPWGRDCDAQSGFQQQIVSFEAQNWVAQVAILSVVVQF